MHIKPVTFIDTNHTNTQYMHIFTDRSKDSITDKFCKKSDFGTKMDGCADSLGLKNKYKNIRNEEIMKDIYIL